MSNALFAWCIAHAFLERDEKRQDFKQLPPATSKPPFISIPRVYQTFDFRVLRQNRRVVSDARRADELEDFHQVLFDVAHGQATERVRSFVVQAYVRGAKCGSADRSEFENSTAVFTKRRYRDAWNRNIVRRIGRTHNHTLKIKARVRAKGQRGTNWYGDKRVEYLRRKCRTSNLWLLQLSGDFHPAFETEPIVDLGRHHMMRAMLTANLAVDQRFANGTQGRIMMWSPPAVESKKALPSSHPELLARFLKEGSTSKQSLHPDIDHIDLQVRPENLQVRGDPVEQVCI